MPSSSPPETGFKDLRRPLAYALLAVIVVFGGALRYTGLNWDDFVGSHPDERFLTQSVLPLLGGNLEFTSDGTNFPAQHLYVRTSDQLYRSSIDIFVDTSALVGVVSGTVGQGYASNWVGTARVREFGTLESAASALANGQVSAVIVHESQSLVPITGESGMIQLLEPISSQELQRVYCLARYPATMGVGDYFDARCSTLNPHNAGAGFYAYGTLPLFMAHGFAQIWRDIADAVPSLVTWQGHPMVWRVLSAFFDTGALLFLYFAGARLHNRWTGLLAALLYAAAPLAIQKAHFGTVNAITSFWVIMAFWAAACVQDKGRLLHYVAFGVAFGCAVAGRINVLPLFGVLGLAAIVHTAPMWTGRVASAERLRLLSSAVVGVLVAAVAAIVVFRLVNPYAFVGPGILGLAPNNRFFDDLASAQFGVSGMSDSPPNYQWVGRMSYVYPLKDIVLWGMGIASGVLAWFGWGWAGWQLIARRPGSTRNLILFAWVLVYFGYMGRQWVMTMRYFLPLYGALALLAAWAIVALVQHSRGRPMYISRLLLLLFSGVLALIPVYYGVNGLSWTTAVVAAGGVAMALAGAAVLRSAARAKALAVFVAGFSVLWGVMFTGIYRQELTRVAASRWQFENVPGDFSMHIEGAPAGTPLVNIPLLNASGDSATSAETLLRAATRLYRNQPAVVEFVSPGTGVVSQVFAPHIGDLNGTPGLKTLYVSLSRRDERGDLQLLAEQTLVSEFTRLRHPLGDGFTIPWPQPVPVEEGQSYVFKAEALDGDLVTGSVMVTEGDWDDRLTIIMICSLPAGITLVDNPAPGMMSYDECNGQRSASALVNSYDMALAYPIDDDIKRESIRNALHHGDYLAITSNRFYDSEARNDFRFPLTNRYYRALFAGDLGYELVATFNNSYNFAGLSVADQHIPIYESPLWFNEFEPDEAFHVYDHPVTFIFRKTAEYDTMAVDAFLNSYPLARPDLVTPGVEPGAQIPGVVYWDSLQMNAAPNGLMQAYDQKAINQGGGTWSERFESDSMLNTQQPVGVAAWWLVISLYGWAAFPIVFRLFPWLSDRGYGAARIVGLFIVALVAWWAASLKVPLWSQAGVGLVLVVMAAFSTWLIWPRRAELAAFIRDRWKTLVAVELLAAVLFLAWIGVRLTNPDLWHQYKGGEKPMDFAMFNAVLRATTFPAADAWYAGGNLNYYYWGYVLFGSPVLLLKIVPAFAYNLIIPTIAALTGIGAYSAAYNIVAYWRQQNPEPALPRPNPVVAGVAAALLCVVLGNLDTVRVFGNGVAELGGYKRPTGIETWLLEQSAAPDDPTTLFAVQQRAAQNLLTDRIAYEVGHTLDLISGFVIGLDRLRQGAMLPVGTDRWYWGPSRVIDETPGIGGNAITEMPAFTFIYGDLHAHMMNLPILLFAVMFVFNELVQAGQPRRSLPILAGTLALGGAFVGMIQATNTWDWPAFLLFGAVGLGYAWWLHFRTLSRESLTFLFFYVGGFLTLSLAASLPYRTWYAATYGSVGAWTGAKTPLWAYLDIWGLFLFLVVSLLIWESGRWLRATKVKQLKGRGTLLLIAVVMSVVFFLLLVALAAVDYQVALVAGVLIAWIAILFFRPGQSTAFQFVLVITGLALAMTLGVEVVVLGGDIGRQNTVFKFYMQAWVLLSVAAGCAVAWLIATSEAWSPRLTTAWYAYFFVLVFVAALFPVMAVRGRSYDRMSWNVPLTLNGLDYLQYVDNHMLTYTTDVVSLVDDYAMIRWLQENVQGTPYIIEGRTPASEYSWTGRIAINTGLPGVLGWRFHQTQQRTFPSMSDLINQREANIKHFYNTADIQQAVSILNFYDVLYVIVGTLERSQSSSEGLAKLTVMERRGLLNKAFEQGDATIFEVNKAALLAYLRENE